MKRPDTARLRDIHVAATAIQSYVASSDTDGDIVFDAIRMRLVEIGEAVKDIPLNALASEPDIPWSEIAGMRDKLTHHYFDTDHAIVLETARTDVPHLLAAVERMLGEGG